MKPHSDQLLAEARSGDHAAILAHLEHCQVDSDVLLKVAAALSRGRQRNAADYEARVQAWMHYKRGRSNSVPAAQLQEEMERWVPANIVKHLLAYRYKEERAEAERRLAEEADPR